MIKIWRVPKDQWAQYSQDAHQAVFREERPHNWDRIDYALLAVEVESDQAVAYVTVREMDQETVYWQYGGAFGPFRGLLAARAYKSLCDDQARTHKRIITFVENTNAAMLRLHIANGFIIFGIRNAEGTILVELGKEFEKAS